MSSFLKSIDLGLRGELFSKFGDILDLESVNKGVIYYPKEIALKKIFEKRDAAELEFINVWRTVTGPDWSRQRTPLTRRGIRVSGSGSSTVTTVKSTPVRLEYDVWYWSRNLDRINQIAERYLFWQQTDPNLDLLYNNSYPMNLDLHFGDIIDESTVREMHDVGTYYVGKMPISVDGWIFTSPESSGDVIESIRLQIFDKDDLTEAQYEEIVDEDSSSYDEELATSLKLTTVTLS